MWFIFGFIAIIATFINLFMYGTGKNYQVAMATALSFTTLTVIAQYKIVSDWVKTEDWSALEDVVPTMEITLLIFTILSIILNISPLLLGWKNKK
ncbi:hypothetical protein [Pseudogracilibacillus sp. ICA-222130]|uniref:hypothetical protein n=1 Tax=Pseudogracilibacillus sp. ICA-222130 TaxID=3134655 RepID=UPI0030C5D553